MRLIILIAVICLLIAAEAKTRKKSTKDDLSQEEIKPRKTKKVPSAIVAIEIVDPNENKTSTRNSKRTIESSLGYGYQQPKYEVYKYSQHDIPPFRGSAKNLFSSPTSNFQVQKSVSYTLPTQKYTSVSTSVNQHYQPGTRLYSTLDQQGHLDHLSSSIPNLQQGHNLQVPVIILRVFPNQLADPSASLHANLPQSHPFAANINSIDIQSLLSNYMQKLQGQTYEQPQEPAQPVYQQPQQEYQQTYQQDYQSSGYQYPSPYEQQQSSGLLTHENYPSDAHTRVIFRNHKGQIRTKPQKQESVQTKTIKIQVPPSISDVQVHTSETPYTNQITDNQNYYYFNQGDQYQQPQYEQPQAQYEQPQTYVQPEQQYSAPNQFDDTAHYSGKPIVVAEPQVYEQQYEAPQQQFVKPHEQYGQPAQYEQPQYQSETSQQYLAPEQYSQQLYQQNSVTYLPPKTEAPLTYVTPNHNHQKRKLRSKKRNVARTEEKKEEKA